MCRKQERLLDCNQVVVLVTYTHGIALVKGYLGCNRVVVLVSYTRGIALVNNGYMAQILRLDNLSPHD